MGVLSSVAAAQRRIMHEIVSQSGEMRASALLCLRTFFPPRGDTYGTGTGVAAEARGAQSDRRCFFPSGLRVVFSPPRGDCAQGPVADGSGGFGLGKNLMGARRVRTGPPLCLPAVETLTGTGRRWDDRRNSDTLYGMLMLRRRPDRGVRLTSPKPADD